MFDTVFFIYLAITELYEVETCKGDYNESLFYHVYKRIHF